VKYQARDLTVALLLGFVMGLVFAIAVDLLYKLVS
jgi:hypothetical protein